MALKITEVLNSTYEDGLRLRVQLNQPPTGTLKFYAHVRPGALLPPAAGLEKTAVALGGNAYAVQVRAGAPTEPGIPARMPMAVVAHDNNGYSNIGGEWLAAGENTDWMAQTNAVLQDTLLGSQGFLDRGMVLQLGRSTLPSGKVVEVKTIHVGPPAQRGDVPFPRVSHTCYSIAEDYLGFGNMEAGRPYSDMVPIHSRIECYSMYQADVYWGDVLTALGMGVFNLLNQPTYRKFQLPCGLSLISCGCNTGSLQEYYDPGWDAWVVSFTLEWQGQLMAGKYSPAQYDE